MQPSKRIPVDHAVSDAHPDAIVVRRMKVDARERTDGCLQNAGALPKDRAAPPVLSFNALMIPVKGTISESILVQQRKAAFNVPDESLFPTDPVEFPVEADEGGKVVQTLQAFPDVVFPDSILCRRFGSEITSVSALISDAYQRSPTSLPRMIRRSDFCFGRPSLEYSPGTSDALWSFRAIERKLPSIRFSASAEE